MTFPGPPVPRAATSQAAQDAGTFRRANASRIGARLSMISARGVAPTRPQRRRLVLH